MKKISVIIPTHNRYDMLCQAIDSTLKQKNVILEIIVVDDCSTDDTCNINKIFPNIKYIRNKCNLGPGNSRRIGYKCATAQYIIFLDDDDFYTCNVFFQEAISILEKDQSISFVSGLVDVYDMNDDSTNEFNFDLRGKISGKSYLNGFQVLYPKPLSTFPTVFRKKSMDESQIESMTEVNDSSIYLRALTQGDAYILDMKIGCYRVHKFNITKGLNPHLIIRNLREKKYINDKWRYLLENPNDWWYSQFKLTYNYFLQSNPLLKDRTIVILWGLAHLGYSRKLFIFLFNSFISTFRCYIRTW